MTPAEIKDLRRELSCTAKELAASIGVDQATVLAWERRSLFPTKAFIDKMTGLRAKGPGAVLRKSKAVHDPVKSLADPQVWAILRKIAVHPRLRDDVAKLAENYPDPAEED